jgi:hypothetical protein
LKKVSIIGGGAGKIKKDWKELAMENCKSRSQNLFAPYLESSDVVFFISHL